MGNNGFWPKQGGGRGCQRETRGTVNTSSDTEGHGRVLEEGPTGGGWAVLVCVVEWGERMRFIKSDQQSFWPV